VTSPDVLPRELNGSVMREDSELQLTPATAIVANTAKRKIGSEPDASATQRMGLLARTQQKLRAMT